MHNFEKTVNIPFNNYWNEPTEGANKFCRTINSRAENEATCAFPEKWTKTSTLQAQQFLEKCSPDSAPSKTII